MKNIIPILLILFLFSVNITVSSQIYDYDLFNPIEFRYNKTKISDNSYQIILDGEDTCFEFLSGDWELAKTGSYNGNFYFRINGPGDGSAKGRWIAEGLPKGEYLVEFFADNGDYPENSSWQVICADGIHDLKVNMNYIPAGWHTLGTFSIDRSCVVNISDNWSGKGSMISADALRFTLQSSLPPAPASRIPPHIGICIDDAGGVNPFSSSTPIYKMLRLPFKLTIAILPYKTYTNQTADEVVSHGSEVILHQPMAAVSVANPGTGGITDSMTLDQVRTTIATNLNNMPHVIGMNNHMGSLITQQRDKMQVCVEELVKRNLFFYDSRTITTAVAYDVAKENGLLTGERDLFIDGSGKTQSMELIRSLALRALNAPLIPHLAIGHIRSGTADALIEIAPELEAMGVEVWPISKCMAQIIETDTIPSGCYVQSSGDWKYNYNDCYSKELRDGWCLSTKKTDFNSSNSVTFQANLQLDGLYDLYTKWKVDDSNTTQGKVIIKHAYGKKEISIDQTKAYFDWYYLGRYPCNAGSSSSIIFSNEDCTVPEKTFSADTVKFMYAGKIPPLHGKFWSLY
jgi:uncharacterized protein